MYRLLFAVALPLSAACSPMTEPPNPCAEATLEIEECLVLASDTALTCDEEAAAAASLCSTAKADGWAESLCRAGLLHYCPAPACEIPADVRAGDDCSAYIDEEGCASCDYYLCREALDGDQACGDEGYYLSYGYKYCERIMLVTGPQLSAAGRAWLNEARTCLMEQIESQVEAQDSCSEVQQIAFDAHPDCYIETGFCTLPFRDKWSVFMTVDPSDVLMRHVLSTGISCFRD